MSAAKGASGLNMNTVELKHQWAMQRNRSLVQTYLLSSSALPLPGTRIRDDFRLPSLSRSTHGRTTTVPLSISEPSLFTPGQRTDFQSKTRGPFLRNRAPSLPSSKSPEDYNQVYMRFSQPLRPIPKSAQTLTRAQRRTTETRAPQPLVRPFSKPLNPETLSIRGKTCVLSQHSNMSSSSRTQLHVFLPVEGAALEDDRDSESVDEGFMDELDNKITSLRLQRDPKALKQCTRGKSLMGERVQLTSS
ncbi:uncharacterized protein LOC130247167 [Danio aesculapii]|uniref:uncharacterized protein LOC130247167 n=1 Tax=Danio aesculapii TaxID=1142201 RepID=UPI0024BF9DA7|nr:uncharacterized protein LOC130247167 [Danio aesculapii]